MISIAVVLAAVICGNLSAETGLVNANQLGKMAVPEAKASQELLSVPVNTIAINFLGGGKIEVINTAYSQLSTPLLDTVVTIDVKISRPGFDKKIGTKIILLKNGKGVVSIADLLPQTKGVKYYLRYSLEYRGSFVYAGRSAIKSTPVMEVE